MLKTFDGIALTLLIIGGINWLLVGAFEFDLVAAITGGSTFMAAQIRARLPTNSPLMLRIKAAVKYREMVTAITPMEDQMEERITTCSSFAIR